jgi:hypothetical protein
MILLTIDHIFSILATECSAPSSRMWYCEQKMARQRGGQVRGGFGFDDGCGRPDMNHANE